MLDVVWSYCPDDRAKQGTTESLPDDLARMKVSEGLAKWPKVAPAKATAPKAEKPESVKGPKQSIPPVS